LQTPLHPADDDPAITVEDQLGARDHGFEQVDDLISLRRLMRELPKREQRILSLRFWGNLTQAQIVAVIGTSQMHVSRLLNASIQRLRVGLLVG
jgi:RNA polymerase sigma-B factor